MNKRFILPLVLFLSLIFMGTLYAQPQTEELPDNFYIDMLQIDQDPFTSIVSTYSLNMVGHIDDTNRLLMMLNQYPVDSPMSLQIIYRLGDLGDAAAGPKLMEIATNEDHFLFIRMKAVEALGDVNYKEAADSILEMIEEGNMDFRRTVIRTLGVLKATQAVDAIIERLKYDRWIEIRVESAYALGHIQDAKATEPLMQILDNLYEPDQLRKAAAEALLYLADPQSLPILIIHAQSTNQRIGITSILAMGAILAYDPETEYRDPALDLLEKYFDERAENDIIRYIAAIALTLFYDTDEFRSVVSQGLKHSDTRIRLQTVKAVFKLNVSGLDRTLEDCLDDEDPEIANYAAFTLVQQGATWDELAQLGYRD